jgi:catechol 2,3-dioxygenase-like lactoylglutathione lyase family enzyme
MFRLSLVTLGVEDVPRARRFYEALGLRASSASQPEVAFFDVGGAVLALWGRTSLAEDARTPMLGHGASLARNLGSKAEVDAAMEAARKAGARILKPAEDTFWGGYSGYFADPDGHPWEVAWNPHWPLDAEGRVRLPP